MIPEQEYPIEYKDKKQKPTGKYFQEALSDFMYDAASGRAIRHLCDTGYTAAQIMQRLDYPTPFSKIQRTITRHLKENGVLLEQLPLADSDFQTIRLKPMQPETLFSFLAEQIRQNEEENAYMACPFGAVLQQSDYAVHKPFSVLTTREREYLESLTWEPHTLYHRLNRRMLEIGVQIAGSCGQIRFYFLTDKLCYETGQ